MNQSKILFIDDEPEFITSHVTALFSAGYDVTVQAEADNALETLKMRPKDFDLIVLDLLMPPLRKHKNGTSGSSQDIRRTGIHVASEIRNTLLITKIPIVYLSVVRDPILWGEIEKIETKYGNKRVMLVKPALPSDLVTLVEQLLKRV